jgi:hypothetical protein
MPRHDRRGADRQRPTHVSRCLSAEGGNGMDADLPAPAEAELVEVQTTAEVVDVIGGEEPAQQDDPEVDEEQARRRRSATCAATRSRKSSSAGRSCWCR